MLAFVLGGCAALQMREDDRNYELYCPSREPICREIEARREAGYSLESLSPEAARGCCKVCENSRACGDSCISYDKQCHQPPGCAC